MPKNKVSCTHTPAQLYSKALSAVPASQSPLLAEPSECRWSNGLILKLKTQLKFYRGYECCIIMPDDVAIEKVQVLEKLDAKVERVRPGAGFWRRYCT